MELWKYMLVWLLFISVVAVIVTVHDKNAAIRKQWRTPEATLMLIGLLGGAAAMLFTMKKIRHKTQHKRFMIGLPLEIAFQLLLLLSTIVLYIKNL